MLQMTRQLVARDLVFKCEKDELNFVKKERARKSGVVLSVKSENKVV